MKIKISYDPPINTKLDDQIKTALNKIGFIWYAQGRDFTKEFYGREIMFERKENIK